MRKVKALQHIRPCTAIHEVVRVFTDVVRHICRGHRSNGTRRRIKIRRQHAWIVVHQAQETAGQVRPGLGHRDVVPHERQQDVLRRIRRAHKGCIRFRKASVLRRAKQQHAKVPPDLAGRHMILGAVRRHKRQKVHDRVQQTRRTLLETLDQQEVRQRREPILAFLRPPAGIRHPRHEAMLLAHNERLTTRSHGCHRADAGQDPLEKRHEAVHIRKLQLFIKGFVGLGGRRAQRRDHGANQTPRLGCRQVYGHRAQKLRHIHTQRTNPCRDPHHIRRCDLHIQQLVPCLARVAIHHRRMPKRLRHGAPWNTAVWHRCRTAECRRTLRRSGGFSAGLRR